MHEFVNSLIKKGLSKRSVEIVHSTMYGAMKYAVQLRKIQFNPCKNVEIYTAREQVEHNSRLKRPPKFIPSDKIKHLLEVALEDDYTYYSFFKFLIETGCRKGEASALRWKDVEERTDDGKPDEPYGVIHIKHTLDYQAKTDDELFGDTKTYSSQRVIIVSERVMDELKAHKERQKLNKQRFKDHYKSNLDLVFAREDGSFIPKSSLFNAFKRIQRKAGMAKKDDTGKEIFYPIHSLRHMAAVLMIEAGCSMKDIQMRLGHSSFKITSDIYVHDSDKIQQDSISKLEKYT